LPSRLTGGAFALISALSLALAFSNPLITVDFSLPAEGKVRTLIALNESLCVDFDGVFLEETIREACDEWVLKSLKSITDLVLDATLGPVRPFQSWAECRQAKSTIIEPLFKGASVPPGALERCLKLSFAEFLGIGIGHQSIHRISSQLYNKNETLLLTAVILFAIAFPLIKVSICIIGFVVGGRLKQVLLFRRGTRVLLALSKWSMLDVFVVAVLIATVKLSAFNLEITSELGLVGLIVSALSSSLSLMLLIRSIKVSE
jgi:hypothetical protein